MPGLYTGGQWLEAGGRGRGVVVVAVPCYVCKQAVVRGYERALRRLEEDGAALAAHAGVYDGHEDRACREGSDRVAEEEGADSDVLGRDVVRYVYYCDGGVDRKDGALELTDVGVADAEVCEERDDRGGHRVYRSAKRALRMAMATKSTMRPMVNR